MKKEENVDGDTEVVPPTEGLKKTGRCTVKESVDGVTVVVPPTEGASQSKKTGRRTEIKVAPEDFHRICRS